jgi:Ca-activated chloride channel family protein
MKKLTFLLVIVVFFISNVAYSNGVAIKNAETSEYFKLISSEVDVMVYDQIAIVVTLQTFLNNTNEDAIIKYGFPLPDGASGTNLRWKLNGIWNEATITPQPQDTTLPGGGSGNVNLQNFLGEAPLFFELLDTIPMDSTLIIELTYVQLLPYAFYEVDFVYPGDYSLIQSEILDRQYIKFDLESQRTISGIQMLSHTPSNIFFSDSTAGFECEIFEAAADADYVAVYQLSPDDMGLFSYSTYLTDTAFDCDDYGNGFFTFLVEPDPQAPVIQKIFTLVIDRSGSMGGDKIIQARDAATYIVNNLNEGDYFNIVDFSSAVTNLYEDHVAFNPSSQAEALNYIDAIYSGGSTNIEGAFTTSISHFAGNDTTMASIIIFFTDGQANVGISTASGMVQHIEDMINYYEVEYLQIHTFGIGEDVNQSMLSQIASNNNGLCQFLGDDELEEVITNFYMMIQNPVLVNTQMLADPNILVEVYPSPLDNLYLGQQLIVVGRYEEPDLVNLTFTGDAFGQQQVYEYTVDLADTTFPDYQFTTKLWAREKMDNLYIEYLTYDPNSPEAEALEEEIIAISMCYNVISPFTSYTGGGGPVGSPEYDEMEEIAGETNSSYAMPNPFTSDTYITFVDDGKTFGQGEVRIYNGMGELIMILTFTMDGKEKYSIYWNGNDMNNQQLPPGPYFYSIHFGNNILTGKMIKI